MRVATALVADYAAQTNDGKLIVAGIAADAIEAIEKGWPTSGEE